MRPPGWMGPAGAVRGAIRGVRGKINGWKGAAKGRAGPRESFQFSLAEVNGSGLRVALIATGNL